MFVRNAWYVAARPEEIGAEPLRRLICNEPIVFFRTPDGAPAALADRCIHRRLPLSMGRLVDGHLQCGYHGFKYDRTGKCVWIPGQENIPRRACVRSYPLVERFGFTWIWMGDAEAADDSKLPVMPGLDEDGWKAFGDHLNVKAHYQLLVDNLIDLSHESYVHTSSIGNDQVAETPIEVRREGEEVFVDRVMCDIPPPPFFAEAAGNGANVDRYQLVHFQPPCYVHVEVRTVPPGSNDPNGGIRFYVLDALTPETDSTTNYFWAVSRNFKTDDQEFSKWWHGVVCNIFDEDRAVFEAQQRSIETDDGGVRVVDVGIDGGTVLARRVVDEHLVREGAVPA